MAYQFKPINRPKYKNKKIEIDGRKFDSQKEAQRYKTLVAMQQLGVISDLRCQQSFDVVPPQRHPETGAAILAVKYVADFVYIDTESGKTIIEDVKGYRDTRDPAYRIFRIKQKLMLQRFGYWVKEV